MNSRQTLAGCFPMVLLAFVGGISLVSGLALHARASAPSPLIVTWGPNTPEWDRKLHVSAIRIGCSDTPASCMKEVRATAKDHRKVFLSVLLKADTSPSYGAQYGQLSLHESALAGVGIDDFVTQYERLFRGGAQNPQSILGEMIAGTKVNPHLGFGLTLYEDELQSPYVSDEDFPAHLRADVDYIHFYLHYRTDTPHIADYVRQVKAIFPNAKVILGVYAYDRISYLPCSRHGQPCTAQQELDFLRQGLDIDLGLVKSGEAAGIEFYPGSFGLENNWSGWNAPRICPGRKSDCIQNTDQMRQVVAQEFSKEF